MALPHKESNVGRLYKNLEYGPAPESPKIAYQWLESHDRVFGHFINGKWLTPKGREFYESTCPANGNFYYCFAMLFHFLI